MDHYPATRHLLLHNQSQTESDGTLHGCICVMSAVAEEPTENGEWNYDCNVYNVSGIWEALCPNEEDFEQNQSAFE